MKHILLSALLSLSAVCTALSTELHVPHKHSPYGINQSLARVNAKDAALMHEMGITWVRVHFFWDSIEKEPGVFDWTEADEAMSNCTVNGYGVLARINTPPLHACDPPHNAIPNAEKCAAFTTMMLERYPGQIHAVEVMNEGNVNRWPGVWERAARLYVPVLKAVYKSVKTYHPDIQVLSAGIWQHPMHYLEDMYKHGAGDYFDIFNFHFYIEDQALEKGGPDYFDALRGDLSFFTAFYYDVMKRYGDGHKPIWVTEFGWSVAPESQSHGVGEDMQAEFTVRAYDVFRHSGVVEKVFPYTYHNTDGMAMIHEGDTSAQFGPSAAAGYRRKVFYELQAYAEKYPIWDNEERVVNLGPRAATQALALENPGLEEGLKGWVPDEHSTRPVRDTRYVYSGEGSVRLTTDGIQPAVIRQSGLSVEPGRGYEVRGQIFMQGGRANEFYPHGMIEITFRDADEDLIDVTGPLSDNRAGETISTQYFVSETFGAWYEVHYPVFAPSNAVTADVMFTLRRPNFRTAYDPVSGEAWFDEVSVRPFELQR